MGWTEKQYRKFKSDPSNSAHQFQRDMCSGRWGELSFNSIPGKALFSLTTRKGRDGRNAIARHGIGNAYLEWIKKQPVAKFTGYPFELYKAVRSGRISEIEKHTVNKQFDGLLKKVENDTSKSLLERGVLCALDVSPSMTMTIDRHGTTAKDVCLGLGIYFSSLLKGEFKDCAVAFDSNSKFVRMTGSFCEKAAQANRIGSWGGTNFQSVIDLLVRYRTQHPEIPISDYPEVLLVVSDMQFNPTNRGGWGSVPYSQSETDTNYQVAMNKLRAVGLNDMTVVWWHVNGRYADDVPSTMDDAGTVLVSGFDPSIVNVILDNSDAPIDPTTGKKVQQSPFEKMVQALDQEVLNAVEA